MEKPLHAFQERSANTTTQDAAGRLKEANYVNGYCSSNDDKTVNSIRL